MAFARLLGLPAADGSRKTSASRYALRMAEASSGRCSGCPRYAQPRGQPLAVEFVREHPVDDRAGLCLGPARNLQLALLHVLAKHGGKVPFDDGVCRFFQRVVAFGAENTGEAANPARARACRCKTVGAVLVAGSSGRRPAAQAATVENLRPVTWRASQQSRFFAASASKFACILSNSLAGNDFITKAWDSAT